MSIKLKPLSQQVVLITGASSGIGLVTATTAAKRGARVLLVARDEDALRRAVRTIVARGGDAAYSVADVGNAKELAASAGEALRRWGRIDTWVNNAGVGLVARLVDTPLDEHERLFKTNYFGAVNGATLAVQHLRGHGGAIVTVASIAADLPTPMLGAYAATKHALKAFVETLRLELIADKLPISVTLIKPSGIDTPLAEHQANHTGHEAVVPPPTYDPQLVADAILDAAVHPRREITVGGAGRLQALMGMHFPGLLDRFAGVLMKLPVDASRPDRSRNSLFVSGGRDRERSGKGATRKTSLYTASQRHPWLATAGFLAVAGGVVLAVSRRAR